MAGLVSVRDFTVVEMPSRRSFFYVGEQGVSVRHRQWLREFQADG